MVSQVESENGVANQNADLTKKEKKLADFLDVYCKNLEQEELQKVFDFCENNEADEIGVLKVHSVQRPYRTEKPGGTHDRWLGHIGINEKEFCDCDRPKSEVKEEVRNKAKKNTPSLVLIENREAEVFRVEVYE